MRLLVYEWCSSGGLASEEARRVVRPGEAIEPLAREGRAMFHALVTDALRDTDVEVTTLVDAARGCELPDGANLVHVPRGADVDVLVERAPSADAVIVVAPETAGILADRIALVRALGGCVIAPSDGFVALAADKQATIDALAAAGVPTPAGRSLAAGAVWPPGFRLPAVRKARASTGSDGLVIVHPGEPLPAPANDPSRLEAWCEGVAVGVACVLGPTVVMTLPPMVQRFAVGASPSAARAYVGGERLDDAAAAARAEGLAVRAVEALLRRDRGAPAAGWVGVDMILGRRSDGLDDRVLEVNPRPTTSFVGLAAASSRSLVRLVVDVAAGGSVARPTFSRSPSFSLADAPSPLR
jgi:tyramine---L-glutamate ligase